MQHRVCVADVEDLAAESATARVLVTDAFFAIDVDGAGMFGVEAARVLLPYDVLHDGEHVDHAFIEEDFGVVDVGLSNTYVAVVDVIDAIAVAQPARDGN